MSAISKAMAESERPLANFPPCIWGDCFLDFSLDNAKFDGYGKAVEELKKEVRTLLIDLTIDTYRKMELINSVYRLGLSYLFVEEIDCQLDNLFKEFKSQDLDDADLYKISIIFQVFRQFGYKLSCDVFNKYKDSSLNTFKENVTSDIRGLLSFYEASQLRIKGEFILDEAFAFTEAKLKCLVKTDVEGNLAKQVKHALMRPFHRGIPMVEAKLYFVNYEQDFSTYDPLLKLAKSHFNYLQLLQREELHIITKWWKDMEFETITPYVRHRITEVYLWVLALFLEPHYSEARIVTSKITVFVMVLDDTCDSFAKLEEIRLLSDAINRWEFSAMEQLPEYLRPLYRVLLNEYADLDKQFGSGETANKAVNASKMALQELVDAYLEEAKWRNSGVSPSFPEYMKVGYVTSGYGLLSKSALIGMSHDIATHEAIAWMEAHPNILKASELISRLHDDVMTFKYERKRGPVQTGVQAYVKSFGVEEKVAVEEIMKMVEDAWKEINEGCLKPREVHKDVLAPIVNLARMIDVTYKFNDGFIFPEKTYKEYITLLFICEVDP